MLLATFLNSKLLKLVITVNGNSSMANYLNAILPLLATFLNSRLFELVITVIGNYLVEQILLCCLDI